MNYKNFPSTPHPAFLGRLILNLLLIVCMAGAGVVYGQAADKAPAAEAPPPAESTAPKDSSRPSYSALADLLEDESSRKQLVQQLRSLAEQQPPTDAPNDSAEAPQRAAESIGFPTIPQRLATGLQRFTDLIVRDVSDALAIIRALASGEPLRGRAAPGTGHALENLLLTVFAVLGTYAIARTLARYGFYRLNIWIEQGRHISYSAEGPVTPGLRRLAALATKRKLLAVAAALAIDVAATLAAALAGYVILKGFTEHTPGSPLFALEFLTAFVMIELAKALSRGVFATRYDGLRLLPISDESATYWNRWLSMLVGFTGYGLLVVVPVAQAIFMPSVAEVLSLIIMLGVYIYAVKVVWKNRQSVKANLVAKAEVASAAVFGTLIRVLARTWHLIAFAYFTVLFVVSQTEQQAALRFMVKATAQSLIAIALGVLLAAVLSTLLDRRIQLPEDWRKPLPLLEARINSYVPAVIKGLRLLALIVVTLIVLDAWHAFDLIAWVDSESGQETIAMVFHVIIILLIAALSWTIIASLIEHRLGVSSTTRRPSEREKTLLMLFRNAAAMVIAIMTALVVLSQIGINIGPLIAGAGVAGLAIGFGAQRLVQDIITGIFIQLDNGMNQNDVVELAGIFGTVEKITIRSVVVRTLDGGYHLIPFSTIDKLTNHTRDYGYHYGEYHVAYRENVDEAMIQLRRAFDEMMKDPELAREVMEEISIPGVTSLSERGFTIRVLIKTTPGNQWAVQRGFNRLVKRYFDEAGIELPYPQTVLHFGRDKDGNAAPVDFRQVEAVRAAEEVRIEKAST